MFVNGKWHEFNCLPVDMPVITKRKYAENLANSKVDSIDTEVGDESMANPHNRIRRMTSSNVVFSVIEDRNPKGSEWLRRLSARNH